MPASGETPEAHDRAVVGDLDVGGWIAFEGGVDGQSEDEAAQSFNLPSTARM